MDKRERKEMLYEAAEQLNMAMDNIRVALRGTTFERHADAYILGHLQNWLDSYNSIDMGIHQYIDKLDEEEFEEDED